MADANQANDNQKNGEDFTQDDDGGNQDYSEQQQLETTGADAGASTNGASATAEPATSHGRDDDRKLFVGGLSWETSEKELREHFGRFGEIENINVKTDSQTGRSRGFAFIVFKTNEAIEKVHAAGEHVINGKKVDPKRAKARHGKIFVGGLTSEISDDEIKKYFGQFGNIVEVELPFDKIKSQRKGFCFITFDSEKVVNDLLRSPKQTIAGKEVDVKRATPKPENQLVMVRGGGPGLRGSGVRGGRGSFGRGGYPQWGAQSAYAGGYGGYGGYDASYGYDYGAGGNYYNGYDYSYGKYNKHTNAHSSGNYYNQNNTSNYHRNNNQSNNHHQQF